MFQEESPSEPLPGSEKTVRTNKIDRQIARPSFTDVLFILNS
jgi:hypothetical protein